MTRIVSHTPVASSQCAAWGALLLARPRGHAQPRRLPQAFPDPSPLRDEISHVCGSSDYFIPALC